MVSRIIKVLQWVVIVIVLGAGAQAGVDPVKDYLRIHSPLGGGPRFFSDDTLLRLEFDFDGDGQKEVLLSIARNRNGKQGNGWMVYRKEGNVFKSLGGVTFSESSVFVGAVEELHGHGLVSFWSGGGGEGQLLAYTVEKGEIKETSIGRLERDPNSDRMRGQALFDKYFRAKDGVTSYEAERIDALEFGPKYGLRVESMTYEQFLSLPAAEQDAITAKAAQVDGPRPPEEESAPSATSGDVVAVPSEGAVSSGTVKSPPKSVARDILITIFLVGLLTAVQVVVRSRKVEDRK